jgi:pyridoxal phosphate enzyme (YggS family)
VNLESEIAERLAEIRGRVSAAARRSGREASSVSVVAVSKTFGVEHVRAAYAAGQRDFGENRVQEALEKVETTRDLGINWHLIGHLQSNKARKAAARFSCIQSVDSVDLLQRLEQAAIEHGRTLRALVQVDLAGEPTKHGAVPDGIPAILDLATRCRAVGVTGLMIIPPFFDDTEATRPYFRRLRELRDSLAGGAPPPMLADLSMGMSHDYEVAIEEGATIVRIGTAIFGDRHV